MDSECFFFFFFFLRVLLNRGKRMSVREWQCDDEERLE